MTMLDRFRLDDRVAIVTGASSDRLAGTRAAVEKAGRRALGVQTDVSRPDDCQALVVAAMAEFGRVDVLVNNTGIGTANPATRETPEQFRQVIDVNLNGCYWMAQACGRVMAPGSSIVKHQQRARADHRRPAAGGVRGEQGGLLGLTRDLAAQWTGRKGIRVNAVAPGFLHSEVTEQYPEGYLDEQLGRVLVGRVGDPEELAAAVVFLAGDAAAYITGTTLPVEGGMLTS